MLHRWLRSFPQSWYVKTFEKWIHRHDKCIRLGGDYVEKWTFAINKICLTLWASFVNGVLRCTLIAFVLTLFICKLVYVLTICTNSIQFNAFALNRWLWRYNHYLNMSLFVLSITKVHECIIQPSLCLIYFNRKLI